MEETVTESRPITLQEWEHIKYVMGQYNRTDGYVDFDKSGKVLFFDSDPKLNGVSALFITFAEVEEIIKSYGKVS